MPEHRWRLAWLAGAVLVLPAWSTAAAPPLPPAHVLAAPVEPPALDMPVQGLLAESLRDTYADQRSGGARVHEALDLMAPRGTPVLAVDDGVITKLFLSQPGGITIYQFDPSRRFAYYYAHLDGYAAGLAQGQAVRRGQLLGYVGSTGNANPAAPHLHFGIFRLDAEQRWWTGVPINPFPYLRGTHKTPAAP
ncbi:M23 family metallopeptidase [Simplicispira psychrophila]|uniref:M23 family metallopeptidase n=1 Tax=Simplicispira psychrophila TaxID=80882 RepID=UPI0006896CFD|nr:M23 family metallopeptidase [Simplicispira psychrophila]